MQAEHTKTGAGLKSATFRWSSKDKDACTVNKLLLGSRDDATEVGAVLSTVLLCILPSVSVYEVPVAKRPRKQMWKKHISPTAGQIYMLQMRGVSRITPGWNRL